MVISSLCNLMETNALDCPLDAYQFILDHPRPVDGMIS